MFDPDDATAFFSKDVGSRREGEKGRPKGGKRVLVREADRQFQCSSLEEALQRQKGSRIEAWVDVKKTPPKAIIVLNQRNVEKIIDAAKKTNLPVIYNPRLY